MNQAFCQFDCKLPVSSHLCIRWGCITEMYLYEDTRKLEAFLERLGSRGNTEALASPITG